MLLAQEGLPPLERQSVEEALYALNLSPDDLGYQKGPPSQDPYRLPLVHQLLHEPLAIPTVADQLVAPVRKRASPSRLLLHLAQQLPGGKECTLSAQPNFSKLRAVLDGIIKARPSIERQFQEASKAFVALTPSERRLLARGLPWLVAEQPELGFTVPPEIEREPDRLWKLLDRVQWQRLWQAKITLALILERLCTQLRAQPVRWGGTQRIALGKAILEVSGVGDDRHTRPAQIILDLGGNDLYTGAATRAWIIDLGGNDRYIGGNLCLGAGVLDVGLLWDWAGNDVYEGVALTQGFGAFGIGLLLDEQGNDVYRAQLLAQGAARTYGVGLLADRSGNDLYQAGGRFLHAPLLGKERAFFAMAQGFAIGYRPDRSGGIGLLWDGEGDDTYSGGTYCQGASYWFSFGCLMDDGGNDKYTAFYYAQASAMHLTVAALIDRAGHDLYAVHMGAIHAIGHDWGVALLWDRTGNDVYAGGDSKPGIGNANGVGLFIDSAGDDRYFGPPGIGNPARDSGSVGLFVDLGGKDQYARGFADNSLRLNGRWGVARDFDNPPPLAAGERPPEEVARYPVGSLPVPPEAELERLYRDACLWEVGTAREVVRRARHRLIGIGLPAARWMVEKKLREATNGLVFRAFEEVVGAIGDEASQLLLKPLRSSDRRQVESALRLVISLRLQGLKQEVLHLLRSSPTLRRLAIVAAGTLQLKEAVPILLEYGQEAEPSSLQAIALALGRIGDPSALEWLAAHLTHRELPVREACADALVQLGTPALPRLLTLARAPSKPVARLALQALGRLKHPDALPILAEKARDPDWGVRLTALLALKGIGSPEAQKPLETALAQETNPYVKQVVREGE